jgi:hypothetical protein
MFCGLLALVLPRLPALWQLSIAVSIEALWEITENSQFIIRRYRGARLPRRHDRKLVR